MSDREPSLKCVIAWSDRRNLCSLVADAMHAKVGAEEVRLLGEDALAIYSASHPSEIRDWLSALLADDESALVLEFERWSSFGPGVDATWLMRRGH
jgi:hypothetical protein